LEEARGRAAQTEPVRMSKRTHPVEYMRDTVGEAMHRSGNWLAENAHVRAGAFDSPPNVSLAQAIGFVLIILIPLIVLYFCRVFVKV
jgi:hypothetical protein